MREMPLVTSFSVVVKSTSCLALAIPKMGRFCFVSDMYAILIVEKMSSRLNISVQNLPIARKAVVVVFEDVDHELVLVFLVQTFRHTR